MKLPFPLVLKWSAVMAVSALLAGCKAESTTVAEELIPVKPAVTNVLTNAANPPVVAVPVPEPVAAPPAASVPKISAQLQEIVTLAERGVGEDVMRAFVAKSAAPFNLTAEEILYLNDLGFSEVVITAMIQHRGAADGLEANPTVAPTNVVAATPPPPPAPPVVANPAPANAPAFAEAAPSVTIVAAPEFETMAQPPVAVTVAPPPVQESYFYSSLQPYGSWVQVADYGYCWQPTVAVVNPDWRPYSDRGRWIYSDVGWYWHSDYSWGWAPFHYGRWHRHPHRGWVWLPDTVWGPAWVTWRYSDSYCGWAPLPPGAYFDQHVGLSFRTGRVGFSFDFGLDRDCYTFVPSHRFYDRTPWRHALPRNRVAAVYNNTTVINNYVQINKNIVNEGISRDRMARITQSEIKKVPIRDTPRESGRNITVKPDRLERNGSELVVYRPQIPKPVSAPANPRDQQEPRKPSAPNPSGRIAGSPNASPRSVPSAPSSRFSGRTEPSTRSTGPASISSSTPGASNPNPPAPASSALTDSLSTSRGAPAWQKPANPVRRSLTEGSATANPTVPPRFVSPAETAVTPTPVSPTARAVNNAPENRASSPLVPRYSVATPGARPSPNTPAQSTASAASASVGTPQSTPATSPRLISTPVRPSPYRETPRPLNPAPSVSQSSVEAAPTSPFRTTTTPSASGNNPRSSAYSGAPAAYPSTPSASPSTTIPSNPRPIPGAGSQPYNARTPIPESRREMPKPTVATPIPRSMPSPTISSPSPQPYPGSGRQPMAAPSAGNPSQPFNAPGRYSPPPSTPSRVAPSPAPASRPSAPTSPPPQVAPSGARPSAPAASPPSSRSGGSTRRNEIEK